MMRSANPADEFETDEGGEPGTCLGWAGVASAIFHGTLLLAFAAWLTPDSAEKAALPARPPLRAQLLVDRPPLFPTTRESSGGRESDATGTSDSEVPGAGDAFGSMPGIPSIQAFRSLVPDELSLPAAPAVIAAETGVVANAGFSTATGVGNVIPSGIDVARVVGDDQRRIAARQPVGEPVRIRLYGGREAEGRSFVFLIDRSKSTSRQGSGALERAESELLNALDHLEPIHRFQVIAYNGQCQYLHRRELLAAVDENLRVVSDFLRELVAVGPTEHEMALQSALQHRPDVVYLLTDGGEPHLTAGQVERLTKVAAGHTAIHCVGFGRGPAPPTHTFLRRLAENNRGDYVYVDLNQPTSH